MSGYNTRRNAELTEAIENANRAALNVSRVNSLVYAVVTALPIMRPGDTAEQMEIAAVGLRKVPGACRVRL
jgi:hypothetical protein